jgi:AcrR family transcriptional regulator
MAPKASPGLQPARSPLTGKALQQRQPRRTQAERLAETRARIIAASVAYIDERGFHQASLQQLARAAGVTVGAVQHHFNSKNELLSAVVEESFQQLTESLLDLDFAGRPLPERIDLFVEHCWQFCNSPRFQASLQILLGIRNEGVQDFEHWVNDTLGHVASEGIDLWLKVFHDIPLAEEEHFDILLFLFSSLSGSALLHRISQMPERIQSDLTQLKQLLELRFNQP